MSERGAVSNVTDRMLRRALAFAVALVVVAGWVAPEAGAHDGAGGISTGAEQTCALDSNRSISCWGDDPFGQVSEPDTAAGTFKAISASQDHTCAIDNSNSLSCWGQGIVNEVVAPDQAPGAFKSLSVGRSNTCAIDSTDSISCWGFNQSGINGGNVAGPNGALGAFKAVSSRAEHTCALDSSNSIICYGDDTYSQSTDPTNAAGSYKTLSVGDYHTCALDSNNSISCWGNDVSLKSSGPSNAPGSFKMVSAGAQHTCAIDSHDSISCWGLDNFTQVSVPNNAAGSFKAVSAGTYHTCAIDSSNSISCWGYDGNPIHGQVSAADAAAGAFGIFDLEMSLKGTPNAVTVGQQVTYQLRMRNVGVLNAAQVVGKLTLAPSEVFVSATTACTHLFGVVTCPIPRVIVPGAGATPSITVTEQQAGLIQATATVTSGGTDPNPFNDTSIERIRVTS